MSITCENIYIVGSETLVEPNHQLCTFIYIMVYTSPTKVARAIAYKSLGHSDQQIADKLHVHRTTIPRIIARFQESGDPYFQRPKTGRPRKLKDRDMRHAAALLAQTKAANCTELTKTYFPDVSRQTLARYLKSYGLVSRVRRTKPYISPRAQEKRRLWAKEHKGWTVEEWKRVVFSDESKFMLFKSDGRQWCWIRPGQALDPRFTKKTVKHGGGSLMVWGCITAEGMGRLHRIDGIMKGVDYVKILDDNLLGTLKDQKLKKTGKYGVIFQQDNDPKHTSRVASNWFEEKRIKKLPWPPSSPDMNIIEHVWYQLDKLVRARDPLPKNKEQLWEALQEEWAHFPKASLDALYESMPVRIGALKEAHGSYTKY
jgi:DDE superfamily endonuclease/Homeodomain-like domain